MRNALARVLFWTYPRGSWQYDVFCVFIILFIVLTPARVFERPGKAEGSHSAGQASDSPASGEATLQAAPVEGAEKKEQDLSQLTRSDSP